MLLPSSSDLISRPDLSSSSDTLARTPVSGFVLLISCDRSNSNPSPAKNFSKSDHVIVRTVTSKSFRLEYLFLNKSFFSRLRRPESFFGII